MSSSPAESHETWDPWKEPPKKTVKPKSEEDEAMRIAYMEQVKKSVLERLERMRDAHDRCKAILDRPLGERRHPVPSPEELIDAAKILDELAETERTLPLPSEVPRQDVKNFTKSVETMNEQLGEVLRKYEQIVDAQKGLPGGGDDDRWIKADKETLKVEALLREWAANLEVHL